LLRFCSGWASGVDRLWGLPLRDGEPLSVNLAGPQPHGYSNTTQNHVFYMGYVGAVARAASLDECGDVCAATPGCQVANYMKWNGGSCSMNGWGFPVAAWGVSWDCDAAFATGTVIPPALAHPPAPCVIETHGPYIGGNGWPAINSGNSTTPALFDPNIPPTLPAPDRLPPLGPHSPGFFTSEFGCTSFSSFESMAATLQPRDWGAHAPPMYWRSYSQDSIVQSHFSSAAVDYSVVGNALTFERQLLLSQLAAALQMKQQIETFRASNTFGTLIWQLGEIFPTGGWGSLEYAHARAGTPGQVLGGRWKPLHYMLESCLFKDVFVA
jgi:beta-mannosidase